MAATQRPDGSGTVEMPAKKNFGMAQRRARGIDRAMPMRMSPPLRASVSESASESVPKSASVHLSPAASLPTPLRDHAERALTDYFASLDGHRPARLYDLVIREVEEPLFRAVLDHCEGNQSRAAGILGINRGTLRKKLREFGLSA
jgi:Fis family transcriptional regulator, factor for inversion stimulation protein